MIKPPFDCLEKKLELPRYGVGIQHIDHRLVGQFEDEEDYIMLDVPNVRLKEEEVKRVGMTKPEKILRPL